MDELDEAIVTILSEDSKLPFVKVASRVGLSESAVRRRVSNLVKQGVIRRFTIERGGGASAITLVAVNASVPTSEISAKIRRVQGVQVIYEITGQYDIAVIVSGANIAEINKTVDEIRRNPGVMTTNTLIILREMR